MADWITVTPDPPAGGYTEDQNEITLTYAQNTTRDTRAAELEFVNPIAEEKHEFNPDSPDGTVTYYIYQFGERRLQITGVSADSVAPGTDTNPPTNFFLSEWDNTQYSNTVNVDVDYSAKGRTGAGLEDLINVNGNTRTYQASINAVSYSFSITVDSTSPWGVFGSVSWIGVDSAVYGGINNPSNPSNKTDYPQDRTTGTLVELTIGANNSASSRSGTLYIVNRQGYVQTINFTQAGYVEPNNPPFASIISTDTTVQCAGLPVNAVGEGTDPDGHSIVEYRWTLNGSPICSNSANCTFNTPSGAGCNTSSAHDLSLIVVDQYGAESLPHTVEILTAPRLNCEGGISCADTGNQTASAYTQSLTGTISATSTPVSGCTERTPLVTSNSNVGNGFAGTSNVRFTGTGATFGVNTNGGSVTHTASFELTGASQIINPAVTTTCSESMSFSYPSANAAPSVTSWNDVHVTNASPTGVVSQTCQGSDPDGDALTYTTRCDDGTTGGQTISVSFGPLANNGTDATNCYCQVCDATDCSPEVYREFRYTNATPVTVTYSLTNNVTGLTCNSVAAMTGSPGASYSFSDANCVAQSGFTCSNIAFSGDSLTGTYGASNSSVNRTVSADCVAVASCSVSCTDATATDSNINTGLVNWTSTCTLSITNGTSGAFGLAPAGGYLSNPDYPSLAGIGNQGQPNATRSNGYSWDLTCEDANGCLDDSIGTYSHHGAGGSAALTGTINGQSVTCTGGTFEVEESQPDFRIRAYRFTGGTYSFTTPNGPSAGSVGVGQQLGACMDINSPIQFTGGISGGNNLDTCGAVSTCTPIQITSSWRDTAADACSLSDAALGFGYVTSGIANGNRLWRNAQCDRIHIPGNAQALFLDTTQWAGKWNKTGALGLFQAVQQDAAGNITDIQMCSNAVGWRLNRDCCGNVTWEDTNVSSGTYQDVTCGQVSTFNLVTLIADTGTFTMSFHNNEQTCSVHTGQANFGSPGASKEFGAQLPFGGQCQQLYDVTHSNGDTFTLNMTYNKKNLNQSPCGGFFNPCGSGHTECN